MAAGGDDQERTEEATPERREEFREKGQIAVSKDVTSVFVLASIIGYFSFYFPIFADKFIKYLTFSFEHGVGLSIKTGDFKRYMFDTGSLIFWLIVPFFAITSSVATLITLFQTRFNWSNKKLKPDFKRLNPISGFARLFSLQSLMELLKGIAKLFAISLVAYLILYDEYSKTTNLLYMDIGQIWSYWGSVTKLLFWSVAGFLVVIGAIDYIYNFIQIDKQLKMTKEEVKEEFKKRESDPQLKAKMKRMARDIAMSKTLEATKDATVVITNPTHFAIALKYQQGLMAPIVVAKGKDHVALRMKEIAKEKDIPMMENKPLARTLYKLVDVGNYIPESLYKAVSEVIRYVYMIQGRKLNR